MYCSTRLPRGSAKDSIRLRNEQLAIRSPWKILKIFGWKPFLYVQGSSSMKSFKHNASFLFMSVYRQHVPLKLNSTGWNIVGWHSHICCCVEIICLFFVDYNTNEFPGNFQVSTHFKSMLKMVLFVLFLNFKVFITPELSCNALNIHGRSNWLIWAIKEPNLAASLLETYCSIIRVTATMCLLSFKIVFSKISGLHKTLDIFAHAMSTGCLKKRYSEFVT